MQERQRGCDALPNVVRRHMQRRSMQMRLSTAAYPYFAVKTISLAMEVPERSGSPRKVSSRDFLSEPRAAPYECWWSRSCDRKCLFWWVWPFTDIFHFEPITRSLLPRVQIAGNKVVEMHVQCMHASSRNPVARHDCQVFICPDNHHRITTIYVRFEQQEWKAPFDRMGTTLSSRMEMPPTSRRILSNASHFHLSRVV